MHNQQIWGLQRRLRGKRERTPMHSAMRKSLVTFGSVESQWSDKGRNQIARREERVGGPEESSFFKS
jgi:hypothetical protein